MSCIYCRAYEKTPDQWTTADILLIGGSYTYVGDGKEYRDIPMRYCQACGARLIRKEKKANESKV